VFCYSSFSPASVGFLLVQPFRPEDGGDMFLENVDLSPKYRALQPRKPYSSLGQIFLKNINSVGETCIKFVGQLQDP
jgi:hypothetical protein